MSFLIRDHTLIFNIIKESKQNKYMLKKEFDIMANYYKNNQSALLDQALQVKEAAEQNDDHYSKILKEKAENAINNLGNNEWIFNEDFVIDSLEKIYKQIIKIPDVILKQNEEVKIMFFCLSSEKNESGSYLGFNILKTNYLSFSELYFALCN